MWGGGARKNVYVVKEGGGAAHLFASQRGGGRDIRGAEHFSPAPSYVFNERSLMPFDRNYYSRRLGGL